MFRSAGTRSVSSTCANFTAGGTQAEGKKPELRFKTSLLTARISLKGKNPPPKKCCVYVPAVFRLSLKLRGAPFIPQGFPFRRGGRDQRRRMCNARRKFLIARFPSSFPPHPHSGGTYLFGYNGSAYTNDFGVINFAPRPPSLVKPTAWPRFAIRRNVMTFSFPCFMAHSGRIRFLMMLRK